MSKAVFLDRDGVINRDRGYVYRREDLEILPGVVKALRSFQSAGYLLIVVTNQSGIARGIYAEDDYLAFNADLQSALRRAGVELTAVYHCPHLEGGSVPRYSLRCDCRKPAPGMLLQGMREHGVDAGRSMMIGDRLSDLQAGRAAGVARCYLIVPPDQKPSPTPAEADGVFAGLDACAKQVLQRPPAPTVQACP
jgi:D-glycero-D-manno-heptose 1,7-bisphosphate phosphatase